MSICRPFAVGTVITLGLPPGSTWGSRISISCAGGTVTRLAWSPATKTSGETSATTIHTTHTKPCLICCRIIGSVPWGAARPLFVLKLDFKSIDQIEVGPEVRPFGTLQLHEAHFAPLEPLRLGLQSEENRRADLRNRGGRRRRSGRCRAQGQNSYVKAIALN